MKKVMPLKESYYLVFSGEGGTHTVQGHMWKHQVWSGGRSGSEGKQRPQPLFIYLFQERQGKQIRIGWFE